MNERVADNRPAARNRNLDLVKIFACVCVAGLHSLCNPNVKPAWIMYHMFGFAIPFFFMASGYMLLNKERVGWKYVLGKILRILRYVFLWNMAWYAVAAVKAAFTEHAGWTILFRCLWESIKGVVSGCLLQQGEFFIFWYMGATIIVYLLLPLLMKIKAGSENGGAMNRHNRLFGLWLLMLIVSVGLQAASAVLGFSIQQRVLQTLRLWCWLQYFLLGGFMPGLIGRVKQRVPLKLHAALAVLTTAASIGFRLAVGVDLINAQLAEYFYDDPLFMVSAFMLFTFIMRLELGSAARKAVAALAPLTLGVYASHLLVRSLMIALVHPSGTLMGIAMFILYIPACFAFVKLLRLIPFSKYWLDL